MASTILCVHDDRQLFQIHEKALTSNGLNVLAAHDGEQALALIREHGPDLVLLDVMLPRMDGYKVLESVRSLDGPTAQTPVVLMSRATLTPQVERRAHELGANEILPNPVPLKKLLEVIGRHVKGGPAPAKPDAKQDAMSGELNRIHFPQVLHQLHGLRASGVLMLAHGDKKKALELRDGYPVAIKSNLVSECFGNHLVDKGVVGEAEFKESVKRMRAGEGLQGEILVAMQVLDEDGLVRALEDHAERKLFELFDWAGGTYQFKSGARLKRSSSLAVGASPAAIVLRGVRERFPIRRIDALLQTHGDQGLHPGASDFYRFQDIGVDDADLAQLGPLDGSRRVASFLGDEEPVRRLIYALVCLELVDFGPTTAARSEPTPAPRPVVAAKASPIRPAGSTAGDEALRSELTEMAARLRGQDHFRVLGVPTTATSAMVEEAYETLARKVHPDRFAGASAAVRQVASEVEGMLVEARDTLLDESARADYVKSQQQERRATVSEEEGRRALTAETEFQRGESLLKARDYEGALLCFGKAVQHYPDEGEYHAHYGWTLYLCHPDNEVVFEEAIEHVRRGVKLAKDREKPYLYLGRLYKVMGKPVPAQKMFTRAVQIQPRCVEALRELRLLKMQREKDKGLIGKLFRR